MNMQEERDGNIYYENTANWQDKKVTGRLDEAVTEERNTLGTPLASAEFQIGNKEEKENSIIVVGREGAGREQYRMKCH